MPPPNPPRRPAHPPQRPAECGGCFPNLTVDELDPSAPACEPATPDALVRWITETYQLKPDVHMPAFPILERAELEALAHFLSGLR